MRLGTIFSGCGAPEQAAARVWQNHEITFACEGLTHLNLSWVGCELEPDYVAIANKRLEKVQGSLF
jgi:hypothetical protein